MESIVDFYESKGLFQNSKMVDPGGRNERVAVDKGMFVLETTAFCGFQESANAKAFKSIASF